MVDLNRRENIISQSRAEQSRAEQSRAEQSRAEQSRADNIDVLKCICAFLIVCIHISFPGTAGEYFTTLTRIAVPLFFMITGFFYTRTLERRRQKAQIKKVIILIVEGNLVYFIWNVLLGLLRGNAQQFLKTIFSRTSILNFLLFKNDDIAPHLWYLNALSYVLFIVVLADRIGSRKAFYYLIPVLLIGDLILGKYS